MKDKKINLILGSHAHIPSGSPDSEFEYVYANRMLPFIQNLNRYSNIQAVLHYSGILLYWIERNHPEFFMLMEDLVARKQVEILGGGFYEPCFPLIPVQDRIGQIELMTTYLRKHFGKRPQGCWIPGFIWEQHLAASLAASDMSYTFLSQDQFKKTGLLGAQLFSPCISEDQGKIISVFPVSLSLEKELSFKSFSQVFNDIKRKLHSLTDSSGSVVACVFPDKVPLSAEETEEAAWNRFFEEISLSENIVETTLPLKILKSQKFFNKGSFPDSSAISNDFSPRRFIIEHDEANGIYSKMTYTNVLINQIKGDRHRKTNAREELWKAQDSDLFTPGSGYLRSDLRKAAYSALLKAERIARDSASKDKGKTISSLIQYDFDFDGINEYLFQDSKINCYVQLKGAGAFELDYLPKDWNYFDSGCDKSGRRTSFSDIITSPDIEIEEAPVFSSGNSRFCFDEQFEACSQDKKGKSCFRLLPSQDDVPYKAVEIVKCYLLKKDMLTVSYVLKNSGEDELKFMFVPQIYFSFTGVGKEFVRIYTVDEKGNDLILDRFLSNINNLKIHDVGNEVQIVFSSSKVFSGCYITVFKNNFYQTKSILPGFPVTLKSGESWANDFSLKFSH